MRRSNPIKLCDCDASLAMTKQIITVKSLKMTKCVATIISLTMTISNVTLGVILTPKANPTTTIFIILFILQTQFSFK